jgi:glycosyltransferase involved in cell wall biosynthesis
VWCRPNGVDIERFKVTGETERYNGRQRIAQYLPTITDSDTVILHVGRVRQLKNQLFLAEAVAKLPQSFKLLMVGPVYDENDPYVAGLRARLGSPDLSHRSYLAAGNFSDIEQFIHGADVFAFPSASEGLGTVVIEALCCGLPVVASHIPGVTDWMVHNGENGYTTPLNTTDFSKRILDAVALRQHRASISAEAVKRYDRALMDEGYRQMFARLVRH